MSGKICPICFFPSFQKVDVIRDCGSQGLTLPQIAQRVSLGGINTDFRRVEGYAHFLFGAVQQGDGNFASINCPKELGPWPTSSFLRRRLSITGRE